MNTAQPTRLDNTAEAAKAKAIYNGMRAEGYDNLAAIHSLCLAVAMLTSPDKTTRETAKRRIRELAAKGKTGA